MLWIQLWIEISYNPRNACISTSQGVAWWRRRESNPRLTCEFAISSTLTGLNIDVIVLHFVGINKFGDVMEPFDIFSARDLRNRSGELLKDAEAGQVSIITKHGKPAILAVPFDNNLLESGLHRSMALRLFSQQQVSLAQAAKLAKMDIEGFLELLGQAGIDAVDYPADELEDDLETAR